MTYIPDREFYLEVAKGNVPKHSIVNKFGAGSVGTTLSPISQDSTYPTPTTATALEFVSSSASDGVAGSGAQEVTVIGLDSNWAEVTQTVITNGTTAVALSTNLTRLYRWYVSSSGTYATETTGSHVGTLTIRESGGGTTWSTIPISPFSAGQSQIGAYSIPTGYTGYLLSKLVYTDTGKTADVFFFQRLNIDDVTTPYSGTMRLVEREIGVQGGFMHELVTPKEFVGPCDIGFMAKVTSGNADISGEFSLLLVQD